MSTIRADNIVEATGSAGVTIDGLTFKNSIPQYNLSWKMRAGSLQSLTSATNNLITFGTEDWDTHGGVVNLASNRIDIPYTGKYWCSFQTSFDPPNAIYVLRFYTNGSLDKNTYLYHQWRDHPCNNYSEIMNLTAGDYVQVYVFPFTTADAGQNADSETQSVFEGYFIGE